MMPVLPHNARQQMAPPPPDPAYCAESNKHEILGITGFFIAFSTVIVALRILVRARMIKSVGADDYVMLVAWAMAVATFACFVGETKYAVGHHIECVPQPAYEKYAKWQYFHSIWVMVGVVLVKISVALFLMRLVPPTRKWKIFLWAVIVFLICFCLACLGTLIFSCIPVEASWDFSIRAKPSTHCFSNNTYSAIGLMNSSINCATDFLLAITPIPIIIKLQVNKRTKISLALILSLGYFACAAGIIKAVKQHNFFDEKDPFWHNSFNVWNMIELCVGIIAASLPALRPLFAKLLETTRKTLSGGSSGSKNRTFLPGRKSYQRAQSNDAGVLASPADVKLHEWRDVSHSTSGSKTMAGNETEIHEVRPEASTRRREAPPPPYRNTVGTRVSAGRDPGDDSSWEDIEVLRSQSEEALTRNSQHEAMGIFKTMEIHRRSEVIEEADRGPRTMGMV